MDRRKFIRNSGLAVGTAMIAPSIESNAAKSIPPVMPGNWAAVRAQFDIKHDHIQMAQMLLASHPKPVRDAIAMHRRKFDEDPAMYWEENFMEMEPKVCKAAAQYMNVNPDGVALTDSTTQGLGTLYTGLDLKPGDEILTTTHDHYCTERALDFACQRTGAILKRIDEFADPGKVSIKEVTDNIAAAITPKTRIVAITWVQSCTGVKLPIRAIADVIEDANANRSENQRIYLSVDGVHGFGNQDEDISAMGCDFFCAGTHKWIFGPRGTGIMWARESAWDMVNPTIPAFSMGEYSAWLGLREEGEKVTFSDKCSPGGFHAFDHRWALSEAFKFQLDMGRDKVHQRTTELSTRLKEGIVSLPRITLYTPMDPSLSAGINCFEVEGQTAAETVAALHKKGIISSASPYRVSYARLTPCVINTEEEVDRCIDALKEMT